MNKLRNSALAAFLFVGQMSHVQAALTLDRSRIIFDESDSSISINITNQNSQDPYLSQGWIEDENEKKLSSPLMVLPPVQRVEAGSKTMVRIRSLPEISELPKDRESVFYFNLREIPPKSTTPNVLMLAMQSKLKLFYRPGAIKVDRMADVVPGVDTLALTKVGDRYELNNPTPYYFSFVEARNSLTGIGIKTFDPVMAAPKAKTLLTPDIGAMGSTPVLMFVNDYGSQRLLPFTCSGSVCKADQVVIPKPQAAAMKQNNEAEK